MFILCNHQLGHFVFFFNYVDCVEMNSLNSSSVIEDGPCVYYLLVARWSNRSAECNRARALNNNSNRIKTQKKTNKHNNSIYSRVGFFSLLLFLFYTPSISSWFCVSSSLSTQKLWLMAGLGHHRSAAKAFLTLFNTSLETFSTNFSNMPIVFLMRWTTNPWNLSFLVNVAIAQTRQISPQDNWMNYLVMLTHQIHVIRCGGVYFRWNEILCSWSKAFSLFISVFRRSARTDCVSFLSVRFPSIVYISKKRLFPASGKM